MAMGIASQQAQCYKFSVQLPSPLDSSQELRKTPSIVSFTRCLKPNGLRGGSSSLRIVCAAEGNGSCCGGSGGEGSSGGSSSGGSCGGKKAPPAGVAGVGAEFENMIAQSTMREFEKEYETGEMEGRITRDVVNEVVNEIPEFLNASNEEKFLDVDAILEEARSLGKDDLIFDVELEEMIV